MDSRGQRCDKDLTDEINFGYEQYVELRTNDKMIQKVKKKAYVFLLLNLHRLRETEIALNRDCV